MERSEHERFRLDTGHRSGRLRCVARNVGGLLKFLQNDGFGGGHGGSLVAPSGTEKRSWRASCGGRGDRRRVGICALRYSPAYVEREKLMLPGRFVRKTGSAGARHRSCADRAIDRNGA